MVRLGRKRLAQGLALTMALIGLARPAAAQTASVVATPGAFALTAQAGKPGLPQLLTLTNNGTTSVTLGSATTTGSFASDVGFYTGDDLCSGSTLSVGQSCTMIVASAPSQPAGSTETAVILVPYDLTGDAVAVPVSLKVVRRPQFATVVGRPSGYYIEIYNASKNQIGLDWDYNNVTFTGSIRLPRVKQCVDFLAGHAHCVIGPLSDLNGGGGNFEFYKGGPAVVVITP